MKAEEVAADRVNMALRHKKSGKVYRTILNQQGFSSTRGRLHSTADRLNGRGIS